MDIGDRRDCSRAGADLPGLSARLLECRGYRLLASLGDVARDDLRLDVVARDLRNHRLVVAVTTTPQERFSTDEVGAG